MCSIRTRYRPSTGCSSGWRRTGDHFQARVDHRRADAEPCQLGQRRARRVHTLWRLRDRLQPRREGLARREPAPHGRAGWRLRSTPERRCCASSGGDRSATPPGVPTGLWLLDVVHTDADLRARQGGPFRLVARNVILAAGTFGSTEILLRSRGPTTRLQRAPRAALLDQRRHDRRRSTTSATAAPPSGQRSTRLPTSGMPPDERKVGPTITGDHRPARRAAGVVIEEMAVPGPLRRVFEEVVTTGQRPARARDARPSRASRRTTTGQDPCAVDGEAIRSSSTRRDHGRRRRGRRARARRRRRRGGRRRGRPRALARRRATITVFGDGIEALRDARQETPASRRRCSPIRRGSSCPTTCSSCSTTSAGRYLRSIRSAVARWASAAREEPDPRRLRRTTPKCWGVVNDLGQVFDGRALPDRSARVRESRRARRLDRPDLARHQPVADDRDARVSRRRAPARQRWEYDATRLKPAPLRCVRCSRRCRTTAEPGRRRSTSSSGCRATRCCRRATAGTSRRADRADAALRAASRSRRCSCRGKDDRAT